MILLACSIPGQPVGKGRPRVTTRGGFARAYTPAKTASWEMEAAHLIRMQWIQMPPLEGPLMLVVRAVGQRPKRLMRGKSPTHRVYRMAKPDGDNVLKAVADSLVAAGVIRDDVDIVEWRCASLYAAKDEGPCVEIELTPIDDTPPARGGAVIR